MVVDVIHPGLANISKTDLSTKLGKMYKVDPKLVVCFGFKTAFGGGKGSGFALIYDSLEALKKFEPKHRQARSDLTKVAKAGRKMRKEKKNRAKKVRGKNKHKPQSTKK